MKKKLVIVGLLFLNACRPAQMQEAVLFDNVRIVKPDGHRLLRQAGSGFELAPELPNGKIEKVGYLHFEQQELTLSIDSIATPDFGNMLHRVYGTTLKRNMGAFGGMMKSYLEYFDKFQIVSLSTVERGGKTWQSLLKKHNEENHYWQSFYTTHKGNLIFMTIFYALEAEERAISTTEFFKYLDAVRFNAESASAQ
ncbi:MAG: hypothetical protein ACUVRP_06730 [Chlorobiales bacterium]